MKKRLALAFGVLTMCSVVSMAACNKSEVSALSSFTAEEVDAFNKDLLEVCNYEFTGGKLSEGNRVSSANKEELSKYYANKVSKQSSYKIDITDSMQAFADRVEQFVLNKYIDNHYSEQMNSYEYNGENNAPASDNTIEQRDLAEELYQGIKGLLELKDRSYKDYLYKVYDLCNKYQKLESKYRPLVSNLDILNTEIIQLEGSLETNFNVEEAVYWHRVVIGEIDMEEVPYTGPSSEELGIVVGEHTDAGGTDESGLQDLIDSGELEETTEVASNIEESTGTNETVSDGESDSASNIEESTSVSVEETSTSGESVAESTSDSVEETSVVAIETSEETTEAVVEEETSVKSTEPYVESNKPYVESNESYVESTEPVNDIDETLAESYIDIEIDNFTVPYDWSDIVIDQGEFESLSVDRSKLGQHISSLNNMLSYENGRYILDIEQADLQGRINLFGGYFITWNKDEVVNTEYSLEDYIYWDNGNFKVRALNGALRDITLTGYIKENVIYINDTTSVISNGDIPTAGVYRENLSE